MNLRSVEEETSNVDLVLRKGFLSKMASVKEIEDVIESEGKKDEPLPYEKGLSTGSALLNLAISGQADVGMLPGYYYYFVGDSNSGKTWIARTCLAEATINTNYDG